MVDASTIDLRGGTLGYIVPQGDEFDQLIDFGRDLTGYTIEAKLFDVTGAEVLTFTTTASGSTAYRVRLTEAQTATLAGTYRWRLRWTEPGAVTRTILTGSFEVTR